MLAISVKALPTNYYFSSSIGNDNNTATQAQNPASPWKSIEKLNASMSIFSAGDSILFKRGDIFSGQIIFTKSGTTSSKIALSAYGIGNKPIINGAFSITGWTKYSNNIWVSNCPQLDTIVTNFFINGKAQQMGRFPNADASNKGYLNIDSHNGKSSISSSDLSSTTDWTGGEAVVRNSRWMINRVKIQSQVGSTLNFKTSTSYEIIDNFGFFIQNHIKTLDRDGEWYYDTKAKRMYVFYSVDPNAIKTEATFYDNNLKIASRKNISISNIQFKSALFTNLWIANSTNIDVKGCNISEARDAVEFIECTNVNFSQNTIINVDNNALGFNLCRNVKIDYNRIHHIGIKPGMNRKTSPHYTGMYFVGNQISCESNIIDSIGYIGILFQGDTISIRNNHIAHFCMTIDDGGGIYTVSDGKTTYTERTIERNFVLDGIGAGIGTNEPTFNSAQGIYLDDRTNNVKLIKNTVANCAGYGIYIHNSNNFKIIENTVFNNKAQLSFVHDRIATDFPIRNCLVKKNIFYSKRQDQYVANFITIKDDIKLFGVFDSNYYCRPLDDSKTIYTWQPSSGLSTKTLSEWKLYTGQDNNSQKSPIPITDIDRIEFIYNLSKSLETRDDESYYMDVQGTTHQSVVIHPYTSNVYIKVIPESVVIADSSIHVSSIEVKSTSGINAITLPDAKIQLSADVFPENATNKVVSWSINNGTGQATISSSGLVAAISSGTVIATATSQDGSMVSASIEITISDQPAPIVTGDENKTQYIDPTNLQDPNENGTVEHPYNSWEDVIWKDGFTYLQKRGTVTKVDAILLSASNISIGSYGIGEKPIIESEAEDYIFRAFEKSNIHFNGIHIKAINAISCVYLIGESIDSITIEYCKLEGAENAIRIMGGENVDISYNMFTNCTNAILCYSRNNRIYYNVFSHNDIAINTLGNNALSLIFNNVFFSNNISISNTYSEITLYNNIFYLTNLTDIAIENQISPLISDNNIFYPDQAGFIRSANKLYNSLNEFQRVTNLDLNSITSDPKFIDTMNENFSVEQGSPAIDAGKVVGLFKDFYGNLVPQGGLPDIGLVEIKDRSSNSTSNNDLQNSDYREFRVFPNPNNGKFTVQGETDLSRPSRISVKDVSGRTIYQSKEINDRNFKEIIDISNIFKGNYIVVIENQSSRLSQSIIID